MKLRVLKKGFNYSQDGPGNRLVYHLQGCNMHCRWCANPESISGKGVLMIDKTKLLDSVCPYQAIQVSTLKREICESCQERSCIHEKRNQGIWLSCSEMETETIVEEAKESSALFFDDGGITFTGGEPTYQFAALKETLIKLKEAGINTAIETNGTHKNLAELFPYIDTLIMDFKHVDGGVHQKYTGIDNEEIKRNIAKAIEQHGDLLIRTPLIDGFNATEDNVKEFLGFYKQFNCKNTRFELLKYHEYGREKWEQCGLVYEMQGGYIKTGLDVLFENQYRANGLMVVRT